MKKLWKFTLGLILCFAVLFGAISCTGKYSQEDLDKAVANAKQSVDITIDNEQVITDATEGLYTEEELQGKIAEAVSEKEVTEAESRVDYLYTNDYKLSDSVDLILTDNKISKLLDTILNFKDENYDVEEKIIFTTSALIVGSQESNYKEFENKPYMVFSSKDSLRYDYIFNDPIEYKDIDENDMLDLTLLGHKYSIIGVSDARMTVRVGKEFFINAGDSVTVNDKTLTLVNVGSSCAVVVDVGGVVETIPFGNTEIVNGIEISTDECFYEDIKNERSATLIVGDDVLDTIESGDNYFSDEEWRWDIQTNSGYLTGISVVYDQRRNDLDREYPPLTIGEFIELPEEFMKFGLINTNEPEYITINIDNDNTYDYEISVDGNKFICDNEEYSRIYLNVGDKFYDDDDKELTCSVIGIDDTDFEINKGLTLKKDGGVYSELLNLPSTYRRDELLMDNYGLIYDGLEDWMDNKDELSIDIPEEQLEITLGIF